MGGLRSVGRHLSTSARFSPACWRPVKYSAALHPSVVATIPPSVAAFHLAFGPDGCLYVTAPTLSPTDPVRRVDPVTGRVDTVCEGLGRPQGLAFDVDGNLYVAASLRGRRGIVRISPNGGDAKVVVAGVNLIGLAFSSAGEMAVVSIDSVYSLPAQIKGTLLTG